MTKFLKKRPEFFEKDHKAYILIWIALICQRYSIAFSAKNVGNTAQQEPTNNDSKMYTDASLPLQYK